MNLMEVSEFWFFLLLFSKSAETAGRRQYRNLVNMIYLSVKVSISNCFASRQYAVSPTITPFSWWSWAKENILHRSHLECCLPWFNVDNLKEKSDKMSEAKKANWRQRIQTISLIICFITVIWHHCSRCFILDPVLSAYSNVMGWGLSAVL